MSAIADGVESEGAVKLLSALGFRPSCVACLGLMVLCKDCATVEKEERDHFMCVQCCGCEEDG